MDVYARFCNMAVVRERTGKVDKHIIWIAGAARVRR